MPTAKPETIDIKKEVQKRILRDQQATNEISFWNNAGRMHNAESSFFNPFALADNAFGNVKTISRVQFGGISCRVLRAVAQKAWIINTCINHIIKKTKPFLKPSSDRNVRGFIILKKGEEIGKLKKDKERDRIEEFLLKTGNYDDPDRDNLVKYGSKIIRDLLTIDQIGTEVQYNKKGEAIAFFAVDSATIERVLPDSLTEDQKGYKYLQVIDGMPCAVYTAQNMIFDFENPRTDIYHSMYGYSYVEQAVDLVTSTINTFTYNAGNFTENKLPKGMLLIDGDASPETIDQMEDYIAEIMSGAPLNQWRIPIIPSGQPKGEGGGIKWQSLNGTSREMEFSQWLDYLTSGIVAMFGCSMDELGIQSQKSQAMFENGGGDRIKASKGLILGDILSFLESYFNRIIEKINPDYTMQFVGYEIEDPSKVFDNEEKEGRTRTTVNELRERNGQKPLDLNEIDNPADLPMNPQLIQAWQSIQANKQMQDGDNMGAGDDGSSWEDYGDTQMGDDEPENAEGDETTEDNDGGDYGDSGDYGEPAENEEPEGDYGNPEGEDQDKDVGKSIYYL